MLVAEQWARWLGMELNDKKREAPRSNTRHLGFSLDLYQKIVSVTTKHRRKVIGFFDRFLTKFRVKGRLPLKAVQRMLGLQIWIGTVFRVARQFLTSICDLLRITGNRTYFYPRKHPVLVSRVIADLSFWRRFVNSTPSVSFDFLLNKLPENKNLLSSDASTSYGMAGVLSFGTVYPAFAGFDGLFWQMSWQE